MLLLGIDVGTSSIKVCVVDAATQKALASVQYPETETSITSLQPGWAEQSPDSWWQHVQQAILKANASGNYHPQDIAAIGISYQMHGLVIVDQQQNILRDSIIWCDSRAIELGNKAFDAIGRQKSLAQLLNSPGNFTASKLAWVKEHEPEIFAKVDKVMLPGDFIAMKFTGTATTSASALSEGVFWDFVNHELSKDVIEYYGFSSDLFPPVQPVFSVHGIVLKDIADKLSLKPGIPVSYKAGDQPNNAFSLNVLNPGEIAATAGTSGVVYGVSDEIKYDPQSRVNTFAHVNHSKDLTRLGVLLCINGTGILNSWVKKAAFESTSFNEINAEANRVPIGSEGLSILPFGNGAERMLGNKNINSTISGLNFNMHSKAHMARAAQEGIVFAFQYGMEIMKQTGIDPRMIRAGKANMFLSPIFRNTLASVSGAVIELYDTDGALGAARGAGIGAGCYLNLGEAFQHLEKLEVIEPDIVNKDAYQNAYEVWVQELSRATAKN
jgi:xylulokinase